MFTDHTDILNAILTHESLDGTPIDADNVLSALLSEHTTVEEWQFIGAVFQAPVRLATSSQG